MHGILTIKFTDMRYLFHLMFYRAYKLYYSKKKNDVEDSIDEAVFFLSGIIFLIFVSIVLNFFVYWSDSDEPIIIDSLWGVLLFIPVWYSLNRYFNKKRSLEIIAYFDTKEKTEIPWYLYNLIIIIFVVEILCIFLPLVWAAIYYNYISAPK